jgi:hypothetical protein
MSTYGKTFTDQSKVILNDNYAKLIENEEIDNASYQNSQTLNKIDSYMN